MKQLKDLSPQEKMIREQLVDRGIKDDRVLAAIRSIPRDRFFPSEIRQYAWADRAAPIGHGQSISQPYIVALMTEKLELTSECRVLEIGTGTGYQTAILARLCASVCTIERVKPLLDAAFERLMATEVRNVHYRYGDGCLGWAKHAPYDRILIAAGAPSLPRTLLLEQLKDDGIAVLPVGPEDHQTLVQVRRHGDELTTTDLCPCRFVKLVGEGAWD